MSADQVRVQVFVAVPPQDAFEVFTRETDLWWRKGRKFRASGKVPGILQFEPGVGGRLFETVELPSGTQVFETGRITVWDPPAHLVFEWRGINFAPGEKTEVEITFEEATDGTRVTLCHRGFAQLRKDHPARHGLPNAEFLRMMGLWWGELMTSFRMRSEDDEEP